MRYWNIYLPKQLLVMPHLNLLQYYKLKISWFYTQKRKISDVARVSKGLLVNYVIDGMF